MHEYIANRPKRNKLHENDMRFDYWVLCRIRKNPESANEPPLLEHDIFIENHVAPLDEDISLQASQNYSLNDEVATIHMNQMDGQGVPTVLYTKNGHQDSCSQRGHCHLWNDSEDSMLFPPRINYVSQVHLVPLLELLMRILSLRQLWGKSFVYRKPPMLLTDSNLRSQK